MEELPSNASQEMIEEGEVVHQLFSNFLESEKQKPETEAKSEPEKINEPVQETEKKVQQDNAIAATISEAEKPAVEQSKIVDSDQYHSIEIPKNISSQGRKNFEAIEASRKQYYNNFLQEKAERERLEQEIAKLREVQSLSEQEKKEFEEARLYRQAHDYQQSEEFKSKYDKRVDGAIETIFGVLAKNEVGTEQSRESLKKIGIFKAVVTENGQQVPLLASDQWQEILKSLSPQDQLLLDKKIREIPEIEFEREQELKDLPKRAEEWQKMQQEKQIKTVQEWNQKAESMAMEIQKNFEFAQLKQLTGKETPEQKLQIEAHNKEAQSYIDDFVNNLNRVSSINPQDAVEICAKAVMTRVAAKQLLESAEELDKLSSANQILEKRVAQLTEELNKIRGSGVKSGSLGGSTKANKVQSTGEDFESETSRLMSEAGV